ncbi:MAG: DinB family protein [Thermomicrobiales bacterium]|nr:DinB family protein [Thermomicrobiales bacterium]MCO5222724.1 DinB family protein [Thermomicrobiales bacterium]
MQTNDAPAAQLVRAFITAADRLATRASQVPWDLFIESEQRTVGQLIDHVAWAWEVESSAFRAIATGAITNTGWTQEWLDAQNAEQAERSAKRSQREIKRRYRESANLALAFIKSLSPTDLEHTGTHLPGEPERTVAEWVEVCLIGHPLEHLAQIEAAAASAERGSGS